ncbi:class I SAM-dependent methyltransferase [Paenibacillus ginsengarvi]|uniref:Class I SAM-dependent methyltransferase n=1 Tax=Paenibacillus ginsengarvi TaxID=400777 RepID=A0A3B0BMV2_9BACL|nr:class I SAM-dependent methyltransferase [Paenibacillus ginsengarvi]RKN72967.1 class I SAM-dependent methyltransferase [Paenibacillus ginsengarvi]
MENKTLYNPAGHPEWVPPHSREWYDRIASEQGEYAYPWKSEFEEPSIETIFGQALSSLIADRSRVLDIGCGHGDFLSKWASRAEEAVGIDIQEKFIATANGNKTEDHFRFLTINVADGLPFPDRHFDVVYSKKGPWLFGERDGEGCRIIKKGGHVLHLIHGSTDGGMRALFPGLYYVSPLPWDRDKAMRRLYDDLRLTGGPLTGIDVRCVEELEYLSAPEDVLLKKCYGQKEEVRQYVREQCLDDVTDIFNRHATPRGLRVVNYYFIVTAKAE